MSEEKQEQRAAPAGEKYEEVERAATDNTVGEFHSKREFQAEQKNAEVEQPATEGELEEVQAEQCDEKKSVQKSVLQLTALAEWNKQLGDPAEQKNGIVERDTADNTMEELQTEPEEPQVEHGSQKKLVQRPVVHQLTELAGEFRNRIYSFCDELEPLALKSRKDYSAKDGYIGQFFSLMQVNKQIRREFLPLYMKRLVGATMDPRKVPQFADTFLSIKDFDESDENDGPTTRGIEISIDLEPFLKFLTIGAQAPRLNVKPLLELAMYPPYFRFKLFFDRDIKVTDLDGTSQTFSFGCDPDCLCGKCNWLRQLQELFDKSQEEGAGSPWGFFLAYVHRFELARTQFGMPEFIITMNDQFTTFDASLWYDSWGFDWQSANLGPLWSMNLYALTFRGGSDKANGVETADDEE